MAGVIEAVHSNLALLAESKSCDSTVERSELMQLCYRCFENPTEHGTNQVSMAHYDRIARARGSREELLYDLFDSLLSQPALGEWNATAGSTRWKDLRSIGRAFTDIPGNLTAIISAVSFDLSKSLQ